MTEAQQRADIVDTVTRMFWSIDTREWDALTGVFADRVTLDYSSIWGGEPTVATPDAIRADWSALLGAFDATQHLLGNHLVRVDGPRAELTAVFQAIHLLANRFGSPRWTLGGSYRIGLVRADERWRIDTVVMTATWADGNKDILTVASGGQRPGAA